MFVPADKTNNLYKISTDQYTKLLTENITKSYKKNTQSSVTKINKEAKQIADNLDLSNRVEKYAQRDAFITLKDHKDYFKNHPKCRLINPAKSEIGIISKNNAAPFYNKALLESGYS